jgi:hypothetical protein
MEPRWGERAPVDLPVKWTARPFAVRTGRLSNVSVSGAFLCTGLELIKPLTRIQVVLDQAGPRFTTPVIPAYVTRVLPHGVGIEWCEFAPKAIRDLIRGVSKERSVPELAAREPSARQCAAPVTSERAFEITERAPAITQREAPTQRQHGT